MKFVFSPDVILCGCLGSKHQLTNLPLCLPPATLIDSTCSGTDQATCPADATCTSLKCKCNSGYTANTAKSMCGELDQDRQTDTQTDTEAHTHIDIDKEIHAATYTHTHARAHTHVHTHRHTYTLIHKDTKTHTHADKHI